MCEAIFYLLMLLCLVLLLITRIEIDRPSNVFLLIVLINMVVTVYLSKGIGLSKGISHYAQIRVSYENSWCLILTSFAILNLIGFLAKVRNAIERRDQRLPTGGLKNSAERWLGGEGKGEEARELFGARAPIIDSRRVKLIVFVVLGGLTVLHAIDADLEKLVRYDVYLKFNDASWLGVNSIGGVIAHKLGRVFLLLLAILCVVDRNKRKILELVFLVILLGYWELVFIAGASRFAMAPWLLWAVAATMRGGKKKVRDWLKVSFLLFVAGAIGVLVLTMREAPPYGLIDVPIAIAQGSSVGAFSYRFLSVFFGGGEVLAIGRNMEVSYPWVYEVLAFSPLISAVDGYDLVAQKYQKVIFDYPGSASYPFSAILEVKFFHVEMQVISIIILLISLMSLDTLYSKLKKLNLNYVTYLSWVGFIMLFRYPVRNATRYIYLTIAISMFILIILSLVRRLGRRRFGHLL